MNNPSADPVSRVLSQAEALGLLASLLPESEGGLAYLLVLLARDMKDCGENLNDALPPEQFAEADAQ